MNELTEFGAENNALARRYGSQSPLVFTMASDAFPTLPANFRELDEELLALRGDAMRASSFQGASAVAARFAAVGLANPVSSGVIAVLEGFDVSVNTAGRVLVMRQGLAVSALQASSQGWPLDSRQSERASLRTLATDEAATANYGSTVYAIDVSPAATMMYRELPFVLAPSSTLWLVHVTANVGIQASFKWRQRRLVSQEASS
jgi:hypothetical protein